jgi:hypothetical protein
MSIFNTTSLKEAKKFSLLRALLKQLLIATIVGGSVLAFYLAISKDLNTDKTIGKHAYISKGKDYIGIIVWHGRSRKNGIKIFQIKQPDGDIIEVSDSYVEVRDNPPQKD